jgi:hypothetical protein
MYYGPGFGIGRKPNILIDNELSTTLQATPHQPSDNKGGTSGSGSSSSGGRKLPVAISVPGNIITEEPGYDESDMIQELFEDLSIYELMDMGRSDVVLGMNFEYQPIKNISDIYYRYNPKKILALTGTFGEIDAQVGLKLGDFVTNVDGIVFLDPETGDLVIAADNVQPGIVLEVELVNSGDIQNS